MHKSGVDARRQKPAAAGTEAAAAAASAAEERADAADAVAADTAQAAAAEQFWASPGSLAPCTQTLGVCMSSLRVTLVDDVRSENLPVVRLCGADVLFGLVTRPAAATDAHGAAAHAAPRSSLEP